TPLCNAPIAQDADRDSVKIRVQVSDRLGDGRLAEAQKRVLQCFFGEIRGSGASHQPLSQVVVACDEKSEQRRPAGVAHRKTPNPRATTCVLELGRAPST